jgi:hypothetical protein
MVSRIPQIIENNPAKSFLACNLNYIGDSKIKHHIKPKKDNKQAELDADRGENAVEKGMPN